MNGDGAGGQDATREARQERPPRNSDRGERGERGDRPERGRGGDRGRGAERGGERASERSATGNAPSADGQGDNRPDAANGFADSAAPHARDDGQAAQQPQTPSGADADGNPGREKRSRDRYGRDRERGPRGERAERNERPDRAENTDRQERAPVDSQRPLEGFATDASAPNPMPNPMDREPRTSYFSVAATPVTAPAGGASEASVAVAAALALQATANATETAVPPAVSEPTQRPATVPTKTPIGAPEQAEASAPVPSPEHGAAPVTALAPAAAAAPVLVPAPTVTQTATPGRLAVAAAEKPGLPKVQGFELPVDSLQQVAQTAGLSWVNSNPEKAASVRAAIAAEPKPIHVPRERPASVQVDTSPLILVETKRDLRNMTLPFEQDRPQ